MKKIIYISGNTKTGNLLRDAFKANGFEVIEPNLKKMSYLSLPNRTIIKSDGVDISDADYLLYRSLKEDRRELYRLSMALEANGGIVIDGIGRLHRAISDKSVSSMERTMYKGGIRSFVPFDDNEQPLDYPVIVKPVDGKYCRGVKVCNNRDEYLHAYHENAGDVIVQEYIKFEHECRVLVVNIGWPEVVYVASKRNVARKGTKRKATFVPAKVEAAMRKVFDEPSSYVLQRKGILGYDIGYLNGETYIIEANYSPRFDRATQKLGEDIADKVVKSLLDES
jgi:glutathione synthase/RimK-type ligase-like ATP-grasp enzyme